MLLRKDRSICLEGVRRTADDGRVSPVSREGFQHTLAVWPASRPSIWNRLENGLLPPQPSGTSLPSLTFPLRSQGSPERRYNRLSLEGRGRAGNSHLPLDLDLREKGGTAEQSPCPGPCRRWNLLGTHLANVSSWPLLQSSRDSSSRPPKAGVAFFSEVSHMQTNTGTDTCGLQREDEEACQRPKHGEHSSKRRTPSLKSSS